MNTVECKGALKVSQDALSEMAAESAREIDGVVCGKKDVSIRYSGEVAVINIDMDIKKGVKTAACAETVQSAVKDSIQNMTGITVSKVNVRIRGQV